MTSIPPNSSSSQGSPPLNKFKANFRPSFSITPLSLILKIKPSSMDYTKISLIHGHTTIRPSLINLSDAICDVAGNSMAMGKPSSIDYVNCQWPSQLPLTMSTVVDHANGY